jgi:hypothetical protein
MVKQLLAVFFFILPFSLLSQEIDRVNIVGKVTAPLGEDVEGVSIYNVSSQQGTITSFTGAFELSVAENDRIAVSALQFSTFTVIVDRGVIDNHKMGIYLNPVVNQLEEVIVRPYDLMGNVIADVGRIKTANVVPQWDLSYHSLEFDYEFSDDQYSSIEGNKAEEAFFNGQQQASLDFIGLAGLLFPKEKKKTFKEINTERDLVAKSLRQRFSNTYLLDVFNISEENANDFIYFAEENGMRIEFLQAKNEILLLDFMYLKSRDYKNRRE